MIQAAVVMGPSGCGKSTLAQALANELGWAFVEGDELHPQSNRDKMAAGIPLNDKDRGPFLDAVGAALAQRPDGAVAACSALARRYRDRLRAFAPDAAFILPVADRATLAGRVGERAGHFMPASLVESQLAALEVPASDERALLIGADLPLDEQVRAARSYLLALTRTPG